MSQSFSGSSVTPSPAAGDALAQTRTLWHYRPDYDYRPDLFQYTELYTTDPDYVVLDVSLMLPSGEHSEHLDQIGNAFRILIARFCRTPIHVSREVGITGIPAHMFASERHTYALAPDLAVWSSLKPPHPHPSYQYERDGVPLLALEVVSHSTPQVEDNDLIHKRIAYASMGIREYWLVDTQQDFPLRGYNLDMGWTLPRNGEYSLNSISDDDSQASHVLGTSLRWVANTLECWHAGWRRWVPVVEIPVLEAKARVNLETRLELLLGMGVTVDQALELGLDLMCMDAQPGVSTLVLTQGNLWQLRRHIPLRPLDRNADADRHYVSELLRACPSYPSAGWPRVG